MVKQWQAGPGGSGVGEAPTPGGPGPAAGAAPLSLQPGPPQQPVVVGGPPGALPGAAARGHAAARRAPGRAWARSHGPHRPLRLARRASRRSPERWCRRRAEAKAAPQSRSNSSSCPRPPRSSRPATGAGDRTGAWLAPARKVSAGEIPAWSPRGKAAWSAPGPQALSQECHGLHARA